VIFQVLHNNAQICTSPIPPADNPPGRGISVKSRAIVCGACGHAGIVANPGYEQEVLRSWALRNGWAITMEEGQVKIVYVGPQQVED
jgi:hypothetical protein